MGSGPLAGGKNHGGNKPATAARMYDYFLGGIHNFPADRQAADAIISMFPRTRMAAQLNRAFLRRAVAHLGEVGVNQFLDIGSGIPTEGNVHEIAQGTNPQARVVYVDIDPVAVAESQEMLEGNKFAIAINGDLCRPQTILEHPPVRKHLDFDQPIAVLLVAVLHFVHDDDQARESVRRLMDSVPAGSYLVLSHLIDETTPDFDRRDDLKRVHDVYHRQTATLLRMRTRAQVHEYFEGLDLIDPGLVPVWHWKPAPDDPVIPASNTSGDNSGHNPASGGIFGGVGRIPGS
jgi:S-adenosyl methyltransferase